MKSEKPFEVVIFIGIPASGKTTFYRERFFPSHFVSFCEDGYEVEACREEK